MQERISGLLNRVRRRPAERPIVPVPSESTVQLAHIQLPVHNVVLPHDEYDPETRIRKPVPGNIDQKAPEIASIIASNPGWETLMRRIHLRKQSGIIIATATGISLIVASAAGFEFGIRGGRDARWLYLKIYDSLQEIKRTQEKKK